MTSAPFDVARFRAALATSPDEARGSDDTDAGHRRRPRFGRVIVALDEVGSTQDEARAFARAGAPDGTLLVAESQVSGRGRRGRHWRSPAGGGLWATAILRLDRPFRNPALLTLAGAVALCEAARGRGVTAAEIKWPNDLIVGDRKFAGVLGEMLADGASGVALLGLGVNIDLDPAHLGEVIAPGATSLRAAGLAPAVGREDMLASIAQQLGDAVVGAASEMTEPLLARWSALSPSSHGRRVVVEEVSMETGDGPRLIRGTTRGIGADGALRLEDEEGRWIEVRHGGTLRFASTSGSPASSRA